MATGTQSDPETPRQNTAARGKLGNGFDLPAMLFERPTPSEEGYIQQLIEDDYIRRYSARTEPFHVKDIIPFLEEGAKAIIKDDISECFEPNLETRWNWNKCLFVMWCFGVAFRHLILFPLRLMVLIIGTVFFFVGFGVVSCMSIGEVSRVAKYRALIRFYSGVFAFSWSSIIKRHGTIPQHRPNQIYVSNHTSMIDYILLLRTAPFAVLAQSYNGWLGVMQSVLKKLIGAVCFERALPNDRMRCTELIKSYIASNQVGTNRLLIFPEGTCVNNKYCIQFKRGAFDLGAEICPIAIKYNDSFTDAYWNSRRKSFLRHLYDLMTSWALVVDIYYLEPQTPLPGETGPEFAARVKSLICRAAGLRSKEWNGYLKYLRPSPRFKEYRQRLFAKALKMRLFHQSLLEKGRANGINGEGGAPERAAEASRGKDRTRRFSESLVDTIAKARENGESGGVKEEALLVRRRTLKDAECNETKRQDAQMKSFFENIKEKQGPRVPLNLSPCDK